MKNLKSVAELAGVSPATVSRVLNGTAIVREPLRQRVLAALAEVGYDKKKVKVPQKTVHRSVAVIAPFITRPFFVQVLAGVTDAATSAGFDVIVHNVGEAARFDEIVQRCAADSKLDAILTISLSLNDEHIQWLNEVNKPFACIDSYATKAPSIAVDNEHGAFEAVKHLLDLGHTRIACIYGSANAAFSFPTGRQRLRGYRRALINAGLSTDEQLEFNAPDSRRDAAAAVQMILRQRLDVTACFATSDSRAITALHSFIDSGVTVPEQMALVGFDDVEAARSIGLTTVRQPMQTMGNAGFRLIHAMLLQGTMLQESILYRPRLVVRRTCGVNASPREVDTEKIRADQVDAR